jgi:hypothetical protein
MRKTTLLKKTTGGGSMNDKTLKRLSEFIDEVEVGQKEIVTEAHPKELNADIQKAEALRLTGAYDEAVGVYLDIFAKYAYSDLMCNLFIALLCAEEVFFAYCIIDLADKACKNAISQNADTQDSRRISKIESKATGYINQFKKICVDAFYADDDKQLKKYIRQISGNRKLQITSTKKEFINEILNIIAYVNILV